VAACVSSALAGTYTVKAGDTLYNVARNYNIDPVELLEFNKLPSPTIQVGQVLKIPGGHAPSATRGAAPAPRAARPADRSGVIRAAAYRYLGIPYRLGATGKGAIDCSAFTQAVMRTMGINLPRTTREQFNKGTPISRGDLRPGDLVFFNTFGRGVSHVGIYIGNGQFAHANSFVGRSVVEDLGAAYYRTRYLGARRVMPNT